MNGWPRQNRSPNSLAMQRRKVKEICDDFGFDYSPAHPTRGLPKGDNGVDEDDKAGEGPSGTNIQKESEGKRKDRGEGDAGEGDGEEEDSGGEDTSRPLQRERSPTPRVSEGKTMEKGKAKV